MSGHPAERIVGSNVLGTLRAFLPYAVLLGLVVLVYAGNVLGALAFGLVEAFAAILATSGRVNLRLTPDRFERHGLFRPDVLEWRDVDAVESHVFGTQIWLQHRRDATGKRPDPIITVPAMHGLGSTVLRDLLVSYLPSEPDDGPDALAASHPDEGGLEVVEPD